MTVQHLGSPRNIRRLIALAERRAPITDAPRATRPQDADGWRLYLLQTKTGQIGPMVDPLGGSWDIVVNSTESLSAQVDIASLGGVQYKWFLPQIGGLLLTWMQDGRETPWIAGPITKWGSETRRGSLTLEAAGIRWLLDNLVVGTTLDLKDMSLGQILWELIESYGIKPGGAPPIVNGSPDPGGRGHSLLYPSWNVANTAIGKLLTEITDADGGPDLMFRPRFATDRRFIEWVAVHGTSLSPRIGSGKVRSFDTTAPFSGITDIQVTTDASPVVSRVWATGSGEGAGTRIARAESTDLVDAGWPFMETVVSDPGMTVKAEATPKITKAKVTKAKVTKAKVVKDKVVKRKVTPPKLTKSMSAATRARLQKAYTADRAAADREYKAAKAAAERKYKAQRDAAEAKYKTDRANADKAYEEAKKKADVDYEAAQKSAKDNAEAAARDAELKQLAGLAAGELNARVDAVDQITVTTSARDRQHGIGTWAVGDDALVTLDGFLSVPDGSHSTLIVKASGSFGDAVTVDFQTGSWN